MSGAGTAIALGVSGRTASGKSTFVQGMQQASFTQVLSFGRYVIAQAQSLGLATDRPTLQRLGNELVEKDAEAFLHGVIEASPPTSPAPRVVVFDGVRHDSIWNAICHRYQTTHMISVACAEAICLQRLMSRDQLSVEEATRILGHPMEAVAEHFVAIAAIVLRTENIDRMTAKDLGRSIVEGFTGEWAAS